MKNSIDAVSPVLLAFSLSLFALACKDHRHDVDASSPQMRVRDGLMEFAPRPISALTLEGLDGRRLDPIKDGQGNVVVINLWATWCPPCVGEMPSLENLSNTMAGKKFRLYAVSMGEPRASVEQFEKNRKASLTVLLDPTQAMFEHFGVDSLPTTAVIDKKGKLRYMAMGSLAWDQPSVIAKIEALVNEP